MKSTIKVKLIQTTSKEAMELTLERFLSSGWELRGDIIIERSGGDVLYTQLLTREVSK